MTADEAIAIVNIKASGRTRYEGQQAFIDEVLVAEIGNLRAKNARLREALSPLARAANEFKWVEDKSLDPHGVFLWATHSTKCNDDPKISVSDAFRARAALADGEKG